MPLALAAGALAALIAGVAVQTHTHAAPAQTVVAQAAPQANQQVVVPVPVPMQQQVPVQVQQQIPLQQVPVQQAPVQQAPTAAPAQGAQAQPAVPAPTYEVFDDWGIVCASNANGRFCTYSQELRRKEDNRLVVMMEVKPEDAKRAKAGLTMPLGMQLDAGVTLQVDGKSLGSKLAYSTCVPEGCMVPVNLDAKSLATLQNGSVLKITGTAAGGGKVELPMSLKGFARGYTRMVSMLPAASK